MHTHGQNNLSVAILGPGAVGGFLAALLFKNDVSVTCIAKESTVKMISQDGLRLESAAFGNFVVHPKTVPYLDSAPNILFVTTKATTLLDALKRIEPALIANAIIVPLLNGIEHMEILRSYFGRGVVAANIGNIEVKRISPNHVIHSTSSARIELASDGDVQTRSLIKIEQLLSGVGIVTEVLNSEAEVFWGKLVRLSAVACTTAASACPIGFVRTNKWWRKQLEGCVKEAAAVALKEGVKIDPTAVMVKIDSLPVGLSTSLQRDILAGKPSELDAIAGAVVRAGARHSIDCPVIESLISMIQSRIAP